MDYPIKEAVTARYSVRTYDEKPIPPELKQQLLDYAEGLQNPFGPKLKIQLIETEAAAKGEKLGTYGIIHGAKTYLAVTVPKVECAAEAVGYEFEQLVLCAASLGLGTCWLGGTFNRSAFAARIEIGENEIFPILSPVGYPQKQRAFEQIFRRSLKADKRQPWGTLFFDGGFDRSLTQAAAGAYAEPLELLRQAPSAANRQPWRVLRTDSGFHFFQKGSMGGEGLDMQRIDLGIAICHFHLSAMELGLPGHLVRKCPEMEIPNGLAYVASWITE